MSTEMTSPLEIITPSLLCAHIVRVLNYHGF